MNEEDHTDRMRAVSVQRLHWLGRMNMMGSPMVEAHGALVNPC